MDTIHQEVISFLSAYECQYVNPHDISICMQVDFNFMVVCDMEPDMSPDEDCVEVVFESNKVQDLVDVFHLEMLREMGRIRREHLLDLYHRGKAYIMCAVNDIGFDSVYFHHKDDQVVMMQGGNILVPVDKTLTTARDFIAFTRAYYKLS